MAASDSGGAGRKGPVPLNSVSTAKADDVLRMNQLDHGSLIGLLARYGLRCERVADAQPIPGSFWGAPEAGLIGDRLLVRRDTPVHSVLHETGHYVCMTPSRRARLHTDAGGDYAEENAVCYLQILLAAYLPGVGMERLMLDMDGWGYSFRLGGAKLWFEGDAEDARRWLQECGLIDARCRPTWALRGRPGGRTR